MTKELQIRIYDLKTSGRSFDSIAKELGIGKTTASTNYHVIRKEKAISERPQIEEKEFYKPLVTPNKDEKEFLDATRPPENIPDKEALPKVVLSGPLAELMEVLPPNFNGTIESSSADNSSKFAWRFGCFLAQHHSSVEIITSDIHRLKRLAEFDPGHDKIIIKKCETPEQIMNEIKRTNAHVIILDSIETLRLSFAQWLKILDSNPDKAIIVLKKEGLRTSNLHFTAKVNTNLLKSVHITTDYGVIEFDMGFTLSNLYTSKSVNLN